MADKAALITGGSSGIGLAVARALGEDGFGITISARRPDKLEAAAQQLRDAGLDVHHVAANMADEQDIKRLFGEHRERWGRLDLLMNNAGLGIGGAIAEAETKKLDMQLDVNLRGVYLATREAIPMLKEAGATVHLTRTADHRLSREGSKREDELHARIDFFEHHNCHFFLSVHHNAGGRTASGHTALH